MLGRALESYGCTWQHGAMIFEVIGEITDIEVIAAGSRIHDIERLRKTYGSGRWRKLKGFALVRLEDGTESAAELHWYEAHGLGKKEMKVKEVLE
jgi:hypothetical protein